MALNIKHAVLCVIGQAPTALSRAGIMHLLKEEKIQPVDINLALRSLAIEDGLVEESNDATPVFSLTEEGWKWVEENRQLFPLND